MRKREEKAYEGLDEKTKKGYLYLSEKGRSIYLPSDKERPMLGTKLMQWLIGSFLSQRVTQRTPQAAAFLAES